MVILVSSFANQGKTTFCQRLLYHLAADYFNADIVRSQTANQDFSMNGRKLAAQNMKNLCNQSSSEIQLVDMICPTKELRKILAPDVIIFIDSNLPTQYADTAAIYERPTKDECRALFVAKFNRHQETVDRLIDYLAANPHFDDL